MQRCEHSDHTQSETMQSCALGTSVFRMVTASFNCIFNLAKRKEHCLRSCFNAFCRFSSSFSFASRAPPKMPASARERDKSSEASTWRCCACFARCCSTAVRSAHLVRNAFSAVRACDCCAMTRRNIRWSSTEKAAQRCLAVVPLAIAACLHAVSLYFCCPEALPGHASARQAPRLASSTAACARLTASSKARREKFDRSSAASRRSAAAQETCSSALLSQPELMLWSF
mmetsp:Transcript_91108/g.262702  ORF Transcript_91108/g.262702 Transcript_91108/m.262702 type:complete len:229 (-) Transcript_91108:642-1328(-)